MALPTWNFLAASWQGMHFTAGKILCSSCDDLFGEFFAPGKRSGSEYMQEAFKARLQS